MKHIDLQAHEEAVKQFFLALPADAEGSVVELNGRAVARVLRLQEERVADDGVGARGAAANWTEQKNARRCALIELEVDGMLSEEEAIELESLQGEMLRERQKLAPVPLADLRRLHQDLMTKAQEQANSRRS